jgi:hypothetical protein
VREWLKELPKNERKRIGEDIMTVQFRWPLGMPLVDHLGSGIWESSQQTADTDRTNIIFRARRRNRPAAWIHQEDKENATGGQSFGSATKKCLHQKQQEIRTSIAEAVLKAS